MEVELEDVEEVVEGGEGKGKGKGRVSPANDELESSHADLRRLFNSLAVRRAGRTTAQGKVRHWEAKVEELCAREGLGGGGAVGNVKFGEGGAEGEGPKGERAAAREVSAAVGGVRWSG